MSLSSRAVRLGAVPAALAAVIALAACAKSRPDGGTGEASRAAPALGATAEPACTCAGAPVVDRTLLAFLSKARAAHHQADLAEEDGQVESALAALEGVVAHPHPNTPEADEVVADTYARLADLESEVSDFPVALRFIEDGLALAPKPTHFRGHLFEMRGVVLERQYRSLEAHGDKDAAARTKAQAVEAFKTAIDIQEQVINEALSDGGR